jgi:hypothetical protein
MFGAYYRPSKDEFERLWKSGLITFDASFLLNLYHYSEPARNNFLTILETLKKDNRLWITHQAALEYQRGRVGAIYKEFSPYEAKKQQVQQLSEAHRLPDWNPQSISFKRCHSTLACRNATD